MAGVGSKPKDFLLFQPQESASFQGGGGKGEKVL